MVRILLLMACLWPLPAQAVEPWDPDKREVDLELFLAVDVSRSMSPAELEIQRRGYAEALSSEAVISRITGGMIGEIAITYVEWAGMRSQGVVVPWTVIDSPEAARAVAHQITSHFDGGMRRTSISGALLYAQRSMEENAYRGLRRVIDISGDGPNNQGLLAPVARDRVLAAGITINGLPLMTSDPFSERWGIPDLDIYYENCVIGGRLSTHFWVSGRAVPAGCTVFARPGSGARHRMPPDADLACLAGRVEPAQ
jgi:hypothetical protein